MEDPKLTELKAQRDQLMADRKDLNQQLLNTQEEIDLVQMQINRLNYSCTCVMVNGEIGIYDGGQQEAAHRRGLTMGLISRELSADLECPLCHGTGVPITPVAQA
jgi:hypothetical protein